MGWLWLMFFLLGMSPGFYVPALTNILMAKGLDSHQVQWAWLAGPVASLLSPVCVGALADNRFSAERLMGWIGLGSAILLAGAFAVLDVGLSPWWFIALLFASSIVAAPMWSTLASISMVHLKSGEREFPLVRLGGTIGWMIAGYATSLVLNADASPVAGYAGAGVRMAGGFVAFFLPKTPPLGRSRSLRTLMGFDAFKLLRERDHCVFFATTALLSIPLVAFYMWTPRHLEDAGDPHATATMALGQFSEILAMLLMAALISRFRVKTLLLVALGLSAVRYGLFAWSGASGGRAGLVTGVALHGMCYTFYFITAQLFLDRRVPPAMRTQAQGLLSLFSNGVGSLVGTVVVRSLYDYTVPAGRGGWEVYWGLLGAMIVAITIGFAFAYVGVPAGKRQNE
ncbi:putative nucleoside transporter YegT [Haloferula helveola]